MTQRVYLAVDLGAESGRVMAGLWNGGKIRLEEIHRFPNGPVTLAGALRWDVLRLWTEIQNGLALAGKKFGNAIVSVGADTWGVDFVLLNKNNEMLGQPYHYRDARTNGLMEKAFKKVPRAEIFAQSGLQFMQFNSLYQLLAWKAHSPAILDAADCLLFMPDFLHWAMCGAKRAEFTIASTSQFVHPLRRNWSLPLLKKLGLPAHFLPKIVPPGTTLGKLRKSLLGVKVVAPPSHDTASAVAGVPTANTGKANWAYISSGTWSLMGVEVQKAALSRRALDLNMTNEGGLDGTYRLLKNIMGLWLVQQCKRAFEARGVSTITLNWRKWLPRPRRCARSSISMTRVFSIRPTCRRRFRIFAAKPDNPFPGPKANWYVAATKALRSSMAKFWPRSKNSPAKPLK